MPVSEIHPAPSLAGGGLDERGLGACEGDTSARAMDGEGDGDGQGGAGRPMRRSRMLSDDARLALQLQDEELKAARGMKRVKSSSARDEAGGAAAAKQPKKAANKPKGAAHIGGGDGKGKAAARGRGAGSKRSLSAPRDHGGSARAGPKVERHGASTGSRLPANQPVTSDLVSFTLEPWPSAMEKAPKLRHSSMTLQEEQTVMCIKRRVLEEAYPGTDVAKIEIRTPTGIKCGQDHSLKYVRTFLWPVSKGDLVLYYSQAADSFL